MKRELSLHTVGYAFFFVACGCLPVLSVSAQTCESPLTFPLYYPDHIPLSGTTCTATDTLPAIGGHASPQKDVVIRLGLEGWALDGEIDFVFFDGLFPALNTRAVLLADCNPMAPVLATTSGATNGTPWAPWAIMNLTGLPPGDYFAVITGESGTPMAQCGQYEVHQAFGVVPPPGSCTWPLRFASGQRVAGNTCEARDEVTALSGGVASPQKELIYYFDAGSLVNRRLYFEAPDFDLTAYVASSCDDTPSPIAMVNIPAGQRGVLTLSQFLSGYQYLVVSGTPAGPADGCGSFAFNDMDPAIITDSREFGGLLQPGYYSEGFHALPRGATPQRIDFSNGTYSYTVTPQGTNARLIAPTDALGRPLQALTVATSSGTGTMRIMFTGAPVTAVGGLFWETALPLFSQQGTLTVSVRSGTRVRSYTIRGSNDFRGFVSAQPIDEIAISSVGGAGRPTIDNLTVGTLIPL